MRRASIAAAALGGAILLLGFFPAGCRDRAPTWPSEEAALNVPRPAFSEGFGRRRVFLDPGHGAKDNTGNRSSLCEDEQDFTMGLAMDMVPRLEATGRFEVMLSRRPGELVAYQDRVAAADAWGADVFISLHSDIRGSAEPGHDCPTSHTAPGFSVLWSDEGGASLSAGRLDLARATADAMSGLGISAYGGAAYAGLYQGDATPGVFVDRHEPTKRIFVLRKPTMPSIIIETHNALDDREAKRWRARDVRLAFTDTVASALAAFLRDRPRTKPPAETTPLR